VHLLERISDDVRLDEGELGRSRAEGVDGLWRVLDGRSRRPRSKGGMGGKVGPDLLRERRLSVLKGIPRRRRRGGH
jgi:hypothetical protein